MYKNMQCTPLQWEDGIEYVSTQILMRCASKQCIANFKIHFWTKNAVFMTLEAKKSVNLISKLECPIQHVLKINKQYF